MTSCSRLDAAANMLGIYKGGVYSLDLFHAERHSHASNFRIDTNIEFVTAASSSTSRAERPGSASISA